MRVLTVSDGFSSSSAPTSGSVSASSLAVYATDAAYVTAKGSAAAEGDKYYNSTYDAARIFQNSAWRFSAGQLPSFASASAYVTAKGSAAENGDAFYNSTEHCEFIYQNGAWWTNRPGAFPSYASDAAFATGKGSAAAEGDSFRQSTSNFLRIYNNAAWATLLSSDIGHPGAVVNGKLSWSVGSNALTIALKTKAGNDPSATDPVYIAFRSTTATESVWVIRTVTSALSVVISSGSTLGHASGVTCPIYAYFIDNAGTVELGAISVTLDDAQVMDSTAEGGAGAADSAHVLYSTTARTGKAICFAGRALSSQATAGTWASAMSLVSSERPLGHDYSMLAFNWSTLTNPTTATPTSPSEGTKTITFPQAGRYRVICQTLHTHSNTYTSSRISWTFGGTATVRDTLSTLPASGDSATDADQNSCGIKIVEATAAGQTLTLVPVFDVAYSSTSHNMFSGYAVERVN